MVGGFKVYEPMIIVTNSIFLILCLLYYRRLSRYDNEYARHSAIFMLMLGISSIFGATGHSVHMQLGDLFFNSVVFMMNAFSLFSIYFNFKFSYAYDRGERPQKRWINILVIVWVLVLLVLSLLIRDFTIIKIHAGIGLLYCLFVFIKAMNRKKEKGSALIVYGILISFLSIVVHSLHISLSIWFNHKDIAHVFMIITLVMMYKGTIKNLEDMRVAAQPATI
jgi:lysylphosphatidylglycerol synthetase-like protein (DUF2156 family)